MQYDALRETEHRLRYHLNGNKFRQELMAADIVSKLQGFTNMTTNQTSGARDGGADLIGEWNSNLALGAVSFSHDANDIEHRRGKVKKFKDDLTAAVTGFPGVRTFIFVTNINFTREQKDQLELLASSKGISKLFIFCRDNLVEFLNSSSGLLARYTYLDMPLSSDEQKLLFDRWGHDLNTTMQRGISGLDQRIDKLTFLAHSSFPVEDVNIKVQLNDKAVDYCARVRLAFILQLVERNSLKYEFSTMTVGHTSTDSAFAIDNINRFHSVEKIYEYKTRHIGLERELCVKLEVNEHGDNIPRLQPSQFHMARFAIWANSDNFDAVQSVSLELNGYQLAFYETDQSLLSGAEKYFANVGHSIDEHFQAAMQRQHPHLIVCDTRRFDFLRRTPRLLPFGGDYWQSLLESDAPLPPAVSALLWDTLRFRER